MNLPKGVFILVMISHKKSVFSDRSSDSKEAFYGLLTTCFNPLIPALVLAEWPHSFEWVELLKATLGGGGIIAAP